MTPFNLSIITITQAILQGFLQKYGISEANKLIINGKQLQFFEVSLHKIIKKFTSIICTFGNNLCLVYTCSNSV